MLKPPRIRTLFLAAFSILALTFFEQLDYTHPRDDAFQQSLTTKNFKFATTTYHNRHGNRCVTMRCGDVESARTPVKTHCDVMYIAIEATLTNKSRDFCAVDYVVSEWESISRTYNDGIMYISNDVVLGDVPLDGKKIHFSGRTRVSGEWFSLAGASGIGVLRQWLNKGKLDNSCENGAVVCHTTVLQYSCYGALNIRACRGRAWGVWLLRSVVVTGALWLALWRLVGTTRILRGGRRELIGISPMVLFICVGVVAFVGMSIVDMIWLLSRMMALRYTRYFHGMELLDGDVYRQGGWRGVYQGYAYVWSNGEESVRIAGPGVMVVVSVIALALFLKRALLDGILVRCFIGVIGVFAGCGLIEFGLRRNARKADNDEDEYLPVEMARRYAKKVRADRVFVRSRK